MVTTFFLHNRIQWMVAGRGRSHHTLLDTSKADGRRMTCIGLTEIPQEIPSGNVSYHIWKAAYT